MFDPYDSPLLLPPSDGYYEPEAAPEPDRIDYALEGISRFMGLFALGITVTLLARWLTALLPFYWIGAIACHSFPGSPGLPVSQCPVTRHRDRPGRRPLHGLV